MNYYNFFQSGGDFVALPTALLLHAGSLFPSTDDFLVWQYFYYQLSHQDAELTPSQIAQATGKSLDEVNQAIVSLVQADLLHMETVRYDTVFDASPALRKLDQLLSQKTVETPLSHNSNNSNALKELSDAIEQEFGRFPTPMELEDLQKTLEEDKVRPELVREALRLAVLNRKLSFSYMNAILRRWRNEGITTLAQVEEQRNQHEGRKTSRTQVSDAFLNAMDLWSD